MKILAIRGKNLASLEGFFEIDFTLEPLKSAGIFAITGSTGSGKSTLLDALCLALFDKTPRTSQASDDVKIVDVRDELISQGSSLSVLRRGTADGFAEVDFVSLGGEKFRSQWIVRRARNKVDGKLQASEIRLTNLSSQIEVQGGKKELLEHISGLIGLKFNQFTRSVLLAQGDFATFLKAGQNEKAELLEKLTGTDIFSRISMLIFEKTRQSESELNLLNEQIKGIELISDEVLSQLAFEQVQLKDDIALLNNEVSQLSLKIKWITDDELLSEKVKQSESAYANSLKLIDDAKSRFELLSQIDKAQEVRDNYMELDQSMNQLELIKTELKNNANYLNVNALLLKEAEDNFTARESVNSQHVNDFESQKPLITKARNIDAIIIEKNVTFRETVGECNKAQSDKSKIEKDIQNLEKAIEKNNTLLNECNKWFDDNKQYEVLVPHKELIVSLLKSLDSVCKKIEENRNNLITSEIEHKGAMESLSEFKLKAEELEKMLPAGIAELRSKLVDGAACPVCGSLHHPITGVIAESMEEAKLNAAKKLAAQNITVFTEKVDKLNGEISSYKALIGDYLKQSDETKTELGNYLSFLPQWQQQFEQGVLIDFLEETTDAWATSALAQTGAKGQIEKLTASLNNEKEKLTKAVQLLDDLSAKRVEQESALQNLKKERALLLDGKDADSFEKSYTDKSKSLAEELDKLTRAKNDLMLKVQKYSSIIDEKSSKIKSLEDRCAELQVIVNTWIAGQNGEVTASQLKELLLKDNNWLIAERKALDDLKNNKISVEATLSERRGNREKHNEAEIKPLEGESRIDLENILSNHKVQIEQNEARNTTINLMLVNHEKGKEKIKAIEAELVIKRELSDNWKKLNEMFGSYDGKKFKLLAQGYTLEVLLVYANKHLQELTKRYELQRVPDALAIQVVDLDMFGELRAVNSLSGGESFLVSLALALGLSSLSSNSMKVESLFIDEGFGSLDADTLRVAMDALERLQTQGRKIGVISHVAEMTERIATQVRVVKSNNGKSRIEVV